MTPPTSFHAPWAIPRVVCAMAFVALVFATTSCAESFDPYNEVQGPRVLALRATPPELAYEESATLDALVTQAGLSYSWSWCPFAFQGDRADECAVPYEDLRSLVGLNGGDDPPPYDLGSDASVELEHALPPSLIADICDSFSGIQLPPGVEPPACDGRYSIAVRLAVSDGTRELITTRELSLLYEDLPANQNPEILGGELAVRGAPPFRMDGAEPAEVARDVEYKVTLDIDEMSAETYEGSDEEPARETLSISWFYEAGAMDKGRSSFIEDFVDFENLRTNRYRTPTDEELESDRAQLYFVIRDDRGGLSWYLSELELTL